VAHPLPVQRKSAFPAFAGTVFARVSLLVAVAVLLLPDPAAAEVSEADGRTEIDSPGGPVGIGGRAGPPGIALDAPAGKKTTEVRAGEGEARRKLAWKGKGGKKRRASRRKSGPRWIRHRVIDCENLTEIAARYAVKTSHIAAWNEMKGKNPVIRPGQKLLIKTRFDPPQREKRIYKVRSGDSWKKIAQRFRVGVKQLYCWNRGRPRRLRVGRELLVWIDPSRASGGKGDDSALPLVAVRKSGMSVGRPDRGRLLNGVQLPKNPKLYRLRNPNNSWGSSHAVEMLQLGVARFRRDTGFDGELVIHDMSRKRGGRFPPHTSHRSGRDVDIRLPLAPGVKPGTVPERVSQVDWDAVWGLVKALVSTGQVKYIFLSRSRQRFLYAAAKRAGAADKELDRMIQYPRGDKVAIVRHDPGHVYHIHVRFRCGENETRCRD
jgi:murein endopeptidase/LysM repeat protein